VNFNIRFILLGVMIFIGTSGLLSVVRTDNFYILPSLSVFKQSNNNSDDNIKMMWINDFNSDGFIDIGIGWQYYGNAHIKIQYGNPLQPYSFDYKDIEGSFDDEQNLFLNVNGDSVTDYILDCKYGSYMSEATVWTFRPEEQIYVKTQVLPYSDGMYISGDWDGDNYDDLLCYRPRSRESAYKGGPDFDLYLFQNKGGVYKEVYKFASGLNQHGAANGDNHWKKLFLKDCDNDADLDVVAVLDNVYAFFKYDSTSSGFIYVQTNDPIYNDLPALCQEWETQNNRLDVDLDGDLDEICNNDTLSAVFLNNTKYANTNCFIQARTPGNGTTTSIYSGDFNYDDYPDFLFLMSKNDWTGDSNSTIFTNLLPLHWASQSPEFARRYFSNFLSKINVNYDPLYACNTLQSYLNLFRNPQTISMAVRDSLLQYKARPKGEFEPTMDYNNRLNDLAINKKNIEAEYQPAIDSEIALVDTLKQVITNCLAHASTDYPQTVNKAFTISGQYDADNQIYYLTSQDLPGQVFATVVPISSAPSFKQECSAYNLKLVRNVVKEQDKYSYTYKPISVDLGDSLLYPIPQIEEDQITSGGEPDVGEPEENFYYTSFGKRLLVVLPIEVLNSQTQPTVKSCRYQKPNSLNNEYAYFLVINDIAYPSRIAPEQTKDNTRDLLDETQTSIRSIRTAYDIYMQTNGTTQGYTIERAKKDARLDQKTLQYWTFSVMGSPPMKYIATSTSAFPKGAGKKVWYDVINSRFHGFGIDNETQP
jgi:hypothetical protein